MKPWQGIVPEAEQAAYAKAGLGRPVGFGRKPALLIIDVQYRTVGTSPAPLLVAMDEFSTSCGNTGWQAIPHIVAILACFRKFGWPVLYPYVAPKETFDQGRVSERNPGIMKIERRGYDIVEEVAPRPSDILLPKKHFSAFFGTPLVSYLVNSGIDSLVVTGCTTSGCVRASVMDAAAYNFRVVVPHDAVYDRSATSHAVNLFDMAAKYADVLTTKETLNKCEVLGAEIFSSGQERARV